MRFDLESDTASGECIPRRLNVCNLEVEGAREPLGVGLFGTTQHETHISRCEKGDRWWRVEKMLHSQSVTIKGHSFFKVAHSESDLADVAQRKVRIVGIHEAMLRGVARRKL